VPAAVFVARRALEGGPVAVAGDLPVSGSPSALVSQGGHRGVDERHDRLISRAMRLPSTFCRAARHAERNGSLQWFSRALWLRGLTRSRRGDLRGAEADARTACEVLVTKDYTKTPGLGVVIESLADQGRVDEAEVLLAEFGMEGELVPNLFSTLPLLTRGRLRAAAGDDVRARSDLEEALRWMRLSRGLWPWMSEACVALVPVLRNLGDDLPPRCRRRTSDARCDDLAVSSQAGRCATGRGPAGGR
jgi:hypothetical protein